MTKFSSIGFPEIILLIGLVAALTFEVVMLVALWRSSASANKKILRTALMIVFNPVAAVVYFLGFREKPGVAQSPVA